MGLKSVQGAKSTVIEEPVKFHRDCNGEIVSFAGFCVCAWNGQHMTLGYM